jgi:hypothetical protein
MSLIKLFPAGNTSVFGVFSLDQGRKIPGNPKIPDRKSLISDFTGFPAGYGELPLLLLTVYRFDGSSLHYYKLQIAYIASDIHSKYIYKSNVKIINYVPALAIPRHLY